MNKTKTLMLGLALTLMTAPLATLAKGDGTGRIEFGLGNLSLDNPSAAYGQYSGLENDTPVLLLNLDMEVINDNGDYAELGIEDFGLDSRAMGIETGSYGRYRLGFRHSELVHLYASDAQTPFNGAGTDSLTLPGGFTTADTVGGMSDLAASLQPVDLAVTRRANEAVFQYFVDKSWSVALNLSREERDGLQEMGGTVGHFGRDTASTILPKPVDTVTSEISASVNYLQGPLNARLEYGLSRFTNEHTSLTWDNPFEEPCAPVGAGPCAAYPATARISLEPNNQMHRYSLSGGYDFSATTRLSALFEQSTLEQDDELLPYDVAGVAGAALPRSSAQAKVDVTHMLLRLTARPLQRLSLAASVRQHETDNQTPSDLFLKVDNDTGSQQASGSSEALNNLAYDSDRTTLDLDGSYYLGRGTTLGLGLQRQEVERSHRAVAETTEDTVKAKLRTRLGGKVSMRLGYRVSARDGSGYDDARVFSDRHSAAYQATNPSAPDNFDTHPQLRQFDIADRDRDELSLSLTTMVNMATMVGLHYRSREDDYGQSTLGLQHDDYDNLTLDVSYSPGERWNAYMFLSQETRQMRQANRAFNTIGGGPAASPWDNADADWRADHDEEVTTLGLGGDWTVIRRRLDLRFDYVLAESSNDIRMQGGSFFSTPLEDLPTMKGKRHTLDLAAVYQLQRYTDLTLGYQYERFSTEEFFLDGLSAADPSVDEVLLLSGAEPDYKASLIYFSVAHRWN